MTWHIALYSLYLHRLMGQIVRNLFCVQVENQDVTARYQDYKSESELDKAALIASNTESTVSAQTNSQKKPVFYANTLIIYIVQLQV